MWTDTVIRSTVTFGLYRSIRTFWYDKNIVWGWIGPVTLVIVVDTADYFDHGNLEQRNDKKKNDEVKLSLV